MYKGSPARAIDVPKLNAVAVAGYCGKLLAINIKVIGTELCRQAIPNASA